MDSYKVLIIGGGMAGLSAARRLLDKDVAKVDDILIVEALDRIGGRILKKTQGCDRSPNHPVDVGACCSQVICTAPPTMYESIDFKPELPQMGYARDMAMGKCIKTVLAYREKWWTKTCGFADPDLGYPITLVFDVSHPGEPMLATFFYGDNAAKFTGDEKEDERRAEEIKGAQRLVADGNGTPDPRSLEPLSVVEGDWPAMPNIFGGYAGVPKLGAITKHKNHRQSLGESFESVHFAGTETSEHWAGYIEGAILSGNRVGDDVAKLFE